AATVPLLGGFFTCQSLGPSLLKGLAQPVEVYQVLSESTARSRLEAVGSTGWTPLVGRGQGVGLLRGGRAPGKEGAGRGGVRGAGGAARGGGGHWQLGPGAGAEGPGGHRAPGVAAPVPVFALLSAQRLVPHDRCAGAGGAALRTRGVPAAEVSQTGGLLGA